jgi:hypothetical protein
MTRRSSLEERVARYFGCEHAVPVGSGTVGLTLLLGDLGAAGRRVAIPSLACPNVAVAVRAAGAIPLAVDMDERTYDISLDALRLALDETVVAVVAVDAFGYPSDIDGIRAVARPWKCAVIEDACQAYGGRAGGAVVGGRGDAGVISFGYAKPLELGGGGFVLTNDDAAAMRMRAATASRAYRTLSGLKNRVATRLMLKDRYGYMIRGERRWGLLRYDFPRRHLDALERTWDGWLAILDDVRWRLHEAGGLLASLAQVESFAYAGREWLPWRYSFKVAAGADVASLRSALSTYGVRTSRLYRPVAEHVDAEVRSPLAAAATLAERTLNLFHRTTSEEAARLRDGVARAVAAMEKR